MDQKASEALRKKNQVSMANSELEESETIALNSLEAMVLNLCNTAAL